MSQPKKQRKSGDGFKLMTERIAQAKAEGCTDWRDIFKRTMDQELQHLLSEDFIEIISKELSKYFKEKGLKETDLTKEELKNLIDRLLLAHAEAFEADEK